MKARQRIRVLMALRPRFPVHVGSKNWFIEFSYYIVRP